VKHLVNGQRDGTIAPVPGAGISNAFQLEGETYMLIATHADHPPDPQHKAPPGAVEIGRCAIHGKLYTILHLPPTLGLPQELLTLLTERELEITTLVALGWPNKQIADHLHISEWTVSTHLRRIFAKLGVHSRAAMVYRCTALLGGGANQV
jgi:DNA-binding NarL/FixJ family response regulator